MNLSEISSKIDAVVSIFAAFGGPAGLAVQVAVKGGVALAKVGVKKVKDILVSVCKDLAGIAGSAAAMKVKRDDAKIHNQPTPKPMRSNTPGSTPTPTPRPDAKTAPDAPPEPDAPDYGSLAPTVQSGIPVNASDFPDPLFMEYVDCNCSVHPK